METIKKLFKTYSRKWYFWVGIFFLALVVSSSGDEQQIPVKKESTSGVIVSTSTPSKIETFATTTPVIEKQIVPTLKLSITENKVVEVVDGDTIKVEMDGSIQTLRVAGIDTPETVDTRKPVQCFGREASAKAKELLLGQVVTLEAEDVRDSRDKYDRLLRYIRLPDGRDYGETMISLGYAHEYTYNKPYRLQEVYKEVQVSAESAQRGLWSPTACWEPEVAPEEKVTITSSDAPVVKASNYYTSSAGNASKYYPASCKDWEKISKSNLRSFETLEALLKVYPKRTLASVCQ